MFLQKLLTNFVIALYHRLAMLGKLAHLPFPFLIGFLNQRKLVMSLPYCVASVHFILSN
jgi:hypothetical protein